MPPVPKSNGIDHGQREGRKEFGQILPQDPSTDQTDLDAHRRDRVKTAEERKLIFDALKANLVCSSLNDTELNTLIDAMEYFSFGVGEVVCEQGASGSHFFVIDSGVFEVLINGKTVNQMKKGKAFGEIALIHDTPRSATVKTSEKGAIWGVTRHTFRSILKQLSSRNFTENRQFLESVKAFEMLTDAQKNIITSSLVAETFADGKVIVKEGEKGEVLYILKSGRAKVTIDGRLVRNLSKGDFFGERALIYNEARSATVTAMGETVCVSVARDKLEEGIGDLKRVLARNMMIQALQGNPVFQQFTDEQLGALIRAAVVKSYPARFTVLDKDPLGRGVRFFIVLEGKVLVSKDGQKEGPSLTRMCSFGDEYVLDSSKPYGHRVDTLAPTQLAHFTSSAFASCLGSTDIVETLDYNRKRAIIKKMFIFRYLSDSQMDLLIRGFKDAFYQQNDFIIQEGEMGARFFIIKIGEVAILKGDKKVRTCGKHDYFGERSLLYDEPRTASVQVESKEVECWVVDKTVFLQVIQGPMLSHLEERIRLQDTKVKFDDLAVARVVGRGTFGVVKLVKHRPTGTKYAMKCVSRKSVVKLNQEDRIRNEKDILAESDHPFIIKLVRTFKDKTYLYFLTELVTGGELYKAMRKIGLLSKSQTQFYLASTILALEYLHDRRIAYRDLKPENMLLDAQGYFKLIDFGCAKKLQDRSYTFIGTPHYMAPEVILGKGYGLSADVWSMGVCLYEFVCGPLPFGNDAEEQMEIFRDVVKGRVVFPQHVTDPDTLSLIKRLLSRIPEVRLGGSINGIKDIKDHVFFKDFDFDRLLGRGYPPPLTPRGEVYADDSELEDTSNLDDDDATELEDEYDWEKDF